MATKQDSFVKILEEAQLVSSDKISDAVAHSEELGQSLRQTLIESGEVTEEQILSAIAEKMGMKIVDLDFIQVPPDVVQRVPEKTAKFYHIFPIEYADNTLTVAMADPLNVQIFDDLKIMLGCNIKGVLAKEEQIQRAIKKYYEGNIIEQMIEKVTEEERKSVEMTTDYELPEEKLAEEAPVVKLVNLLFKQAVHDRASDIHIEPFARGVKVRFRIDGVLHEMTPPPKQWQNAIISRIKILSGMDLAEKRIPQDGRIKLHIEGKNLDVRVSALPALYGPSIVMRLLDQSTVLLGLEDVGFLPDNIEIFQQQIRKPNGILLLTGPTGSGKTTTLYAALSSINTVDKKLITVEDPVEYQINGINQMQVNTDIGLTFAVGLRHMLRQSPDVILVGECRDTETAEIAIRAALTGHLVFSTLHTNDAPSATTRLIDMGIKPFLVASSLQAVVAQRLIRKICNSCKEPYKPDAETIKLVNPPPEQRDDLVLYRGRGCEKCNYSGYKGRTAIHEIMVLNEEIRQLVLERTASNTIKKVAQKYGMRTLREDGMKKVLLGQTTPQEVMRITATDIA
ncbi:MAG: type II secretion system ATPase GspE [bacterium]|nr:type II secretion system ATPase GspE [bacterium]